MRLDIVTVRESECVTWHSNSAERKAGAHLVEAMEQSAKSEQLSSGCMVPAAVSVVCTREVRRVAASGQVRGAPVCLLLSLRRQDLPAFGMAGPWGRRVRAKRQIGLTGHLHTGLRRSQGLSLSSSG